MKKIWLTAVKFIIIVFKLSSVFKFKTFTNIKTENSDVKIENDEISRKLTSESLKINDDENSKFVVRRSKIKTDETVFINKTIFTFIEDNDSFFHCLINDCVSAETNSDIMIVRDINFQMYSEIMKNENVDLKNYEVFFEVNEKKIYAKNQTIFRAVVAAQKNQKMNIFEFVLKLKTTNN